VAATVGITRGRRWRAVYNVHVGARQALPASLRRLFWDYRARDLRLDRDAALIVRRVLAEGGWSEIRVLRARLGDDAIRAVLLSSGARGLSPARIRFWQLVLGLPARRADAWVRAARAGSWAARRHA
jgi:hypothetical protein